MASRNYPSNGAPTVRDTMRREGVPRPLDPADLSDAWDRLIDAYDEARQYGEEAAP